MAFCQAHQTAIKTLNHEYSTTIHLCYSEFYELLVPSGIDVCMLKVLKNIVAVERLLYLDGYRVLALLIQPEGQDSFAFQCAIDQG